MQIITYTEFPLILFLTYNKDNAPEHLPFEVANDSVSKYLQTAKGFHEMFGYFGSVNTLKPNILPSNYYLPDHVFHKIDSNDFFRNSMFVDFFKVYIKPTYGVVTFKGGGQYVYILLSKQDSLTLKNVHGRYIATAFFAGNFFIGFEEAVITDEGLKVFDTGHYASGMDRGGYLSFVIIFMNYLNGKSTLIPLNTEQNKTTEVILKVD